MTPFPTLFTAPVYRPANNTVELTVSNFFYEDHINGTQKPLDVYLGNLGPLRHRVYQATPPGPLTNISPFVQSASGLSDITGSPSGEPQSSVQSPVSSGSSGLQRYIASGPLHTIVIVEMPSLADVMKALEEDALPVDATATANNDHSVQPDDSETSDAPLGHNGNGIPSPSITGRSLPLLFIRSSDGVGYHSGRTIACENVFQTMDLGMTGSPSNSPGGHIDTGWLTAAQLAAQQDGGLHGWTLRVM